MRVAEIYKSIQGEGFLTGTESVFVRASGCNLRCQFCDTPHTSWNPSGEDLSIDEIVQRIEAENCRHIVLTGGEPMLFAELMPICEQLRSRGMHITIETAGTLYLPLECDLMSISPKLSNSTPEKATAGSWFQRHERTRHAPEVMRRLVQNYDYQIKFVISSQADCREVEVYLTELREISRDRVLLMPEGTDNRTLQRTAMWLEPFCLEKGFRFCPRKQIEWFGLMRCT